MIVILLLLSYGLVLYFGQKKYGQWINEHDLKYYPLKTFLPAGIYILSLVKYRFGSNEDKRLFAKLSYLVDSHLAQDYVKIHWANRIVMVMAGMLPGAVFLTAMDGDIINGVFCLGVVILLIYLGERETDKWIERKKQGIAWDFPEFLNMLTLLIGAGLTVSNAWEKVANNSRTRSHLYIEAGRTIREIRSGKSEIKAYEDFSRRIKDVQVSRFVSVLIQNLRKGNKELSTILSVIAGESWINRKNTVKKLGEEASTKLLFPMMLMFVALIMVIVTPAVMSIQNM